MDDTAILPSLGVSVTYDVDFHAWTQDQGRKLRNRRFDALDLPNLAEEIESMGRSEKRELASRLAVLLTHLLQWAAQPARRGRSRTRTIRVQRRQIALVLNDNPSLRALLPDMVREAYEYSRLTAMDETRLEAAHFPPSCPWAWDQMRDYGFLPDPFDPR